MAAFASPFTGASLRRAAPAASTTPRCAMGDSIAPAIKLKDTKNDGTSSVSVDWAKVPPNVTVAQSVEANTALYVSLRSRTNSPSALPPKDPAPDDIAPADYYFPAETRNTAPVISLAYNESISVSYDPINPAVGGVAANSVDSVAFWKETPYKWTAPDSASTSPPETLSTKLYEKYFPSNIRNLAPMIRMKKPAGDWDASAYLEYGTEFVDLNVDLARQVAVQTEEDGPSPAGAAAVAKNFNESRLHQAPQITIVEDEKVEISLEEVSEPSSLARIILSGEGEGEA